MCVVREDQVGVGVSSLVVCPAVDCFIFTASVASRSAANSISPRLGTVTISPSPGKTSSDSLSVSHCHTSGRADLPVLDGGM